MNRLYIERCMILFYLVVLQGRSSIGRTVSQPEAQFTSLTTKRRRDKRESLVSQQQLEWKRALLRLPLGRLAALSRVADNWKSESSHVTANAAAGEPCWNTANNGLTRLHPSPGTGWIRF